MSTSPTALHSTMNSHDSIKSASRLDNKIFNPTSNITDSYQNVTKEEIHSPMLGSVFATNSHDSSDHKYQSNSKLANSITEAIPQSTITPTSLKPITSDSPYRSPLSGSPAAVDAPAEWKSMNKTMPSSNFENSSTFRPSPLSSPSGYSNTSTGTMRAESASQEQSDSSLSPQTVEAMMHTLLSILWEREKHRKKEELKIEARETREKDKDDNSEEDDDNDEFERDDSFANCSVIACNEYDKSLHSAPDEAHQMQSQLGSSHKSKANTGIISPMNIKNLQLKSLQMDKLKKKKKKKKKSKKTSKANTRTASPYHLQCFSKDEIDALIKKSSSSASSSASTSSSSSLPLSSKQHQPHHPRNLNFRQSSLSTTKMPHSLSVLLRRSKAETLLLRHQQKLAESSASAAERREREIEKELQREEKEGAKTKRELQKKEEEIRIEKKGADALRKRNVQLASECNRLESELQILKEMRQSQISSSPSALSSRRTSRTLASELKSQRISSKKNPLPKEQ
ncbi:uncharacterized protein MONOS_2440 [Monocercomonoides exilis]|uniref:uncharacterized protein n=1 Tax=Monocercomonoides exilis TaxID=2049356 RepID=UPI00355A1564|nr:hypothetical protein MONOS_2440 [Monocercomonoides exilis]|eukprot:MONOS_2440.1-p1 / transcript=MONOS_2440.1 / gene=MONOS_2440 / organism=Monocercomonoides_exilis_PA203 / gene_product=unspecified product / transcript_product=unspecified product / location=Mono_scaffold00050:120715-122250(+) / protein_length=512 / sequence_SO=supercontig / SO=protein_coding / is_pseudo=false